MRASVVVRGSFQTPDPVYMLAVHQEGLPPNVSYPPVIIAKCDNVLTNNRVYIMDIPSPQSCESCYNRNQYPTVRTL